MWSSHHNLYVYLTEVGTSIAFSFLNTYGGFLSYSLSLNQLLLLLIWFTYSIDYFTIKSLLVNILDAFSTLYAIEKLEEFVQ